MGRRNKDRSEIEHLRGEIRKLRSENKQLRRLVNASRKQISLDNDIREEYIELVAGKENKLTALICPKCGHKPLAQISANNKTYDVCHQCSYRKIVHNGQEN